ncbi:glycoside hydrolase family 99-like domain-containing protein [uncultured Draconibacterium sp.]|uniref:glycoside hydrolase family 99-like domain-containing protein n=1 Tax=uncultured Draconibacterium sp. TaxID=1573823 RepID=UPI0029C8CF9B|nr:glycoside hydrolase family 99-like domain-containing protein [uncultured Draconibacterium sp.]
MKIKNYIILLFIGLTAFSCVEDDGIFVEDHFLNEEVPIVAVDADYVVGAHYSKFQWKSTVTEEPTLGKYDGERGDPEIYAQHVSQAQTGGIDYFLLTLRSTVNVAEFQTDSTFIDTLQMASNAAEMKFALSYNFGSMGLQDSKRIEDQGLVSTFLNDFKKMMPFFQMSNYMKVDGRCIVFMDGSQDLHSNDNKALYDQLRSQMSGLGVELFLIGYQNSWTPPLRYDFRFVDCVDAVTHDTYTTVSKYHNERTTFFQKMCWQAWKYHQETFAANGIEYIPTIAPSNNPLINNSGSQNWVVEKDATWFSDNCNVARNVAGAHKLILVDSFNDWNRGTQLESANTYGEEFLQILRREFKVN